MGTNMVWRLIQNSHDCVVFDTSPRTVSKFAKENAIGAARGMILPASAEGLSLHAREMIVNSDPRAGDLDAYERVLVATIEEDATLFGREDYLEEERRIVDPILKGGARRIRATEQVGLVTPPGGWENPSIGEGNLSLASQAASESGSDDP